MDFPTYAVQSAILCGNVFCRRKAAIVLWKVAESLRFDCGQYGSFTVFAVYLRFPAVFCMLWNSREQRLEPHKWEVV